MPAQPAARHACIMQPRVSPKHSICVSRQHCHSLVYRNTCTEPTARHQVLEAKLQHILIFSTTRCNLLAAGQPNIKCITSG
jgi:hypothetical protein